MKKFWFAFVFVLFGNFAQAQMTDTLGTLAIDGALTGESSASVAKMNAAFEQMQLQQDVTALVAEIQTTFMGNYQSIDKDLLGFYGLKNIAWKVYPVSDFEFYIELQNVNAADCILCQNNVWSAKKVDINDGGNCKEQNNLIKLYFE